MDKTIQDFQKEEAIKCFNECWNLIDKENRTPEDDLMMIHCAHASRYLWGQVGQPIHFERGEWQISKVYSILGKGDQALYHANACLTICIDQEIKDFDITFAYEAMANAYKVLGNTEMVDHYKEKAYNCLDDIKDKGDRDYAKSELDKI